MTQGTGLLFSYKELLHEQFLQTDLGELYQAIPFEALAKKIPLPKHSISGRGRKPWFNVQGGIALQILKHYLGVSDAMLIERINTDWSMQLFCGIALKPGERILDMDLPSEWRSYLGKYLDIDRLQKTLAEHWKPHMNATHVGMQDATCYESRIAYPTDVKLLWECCTEVHAILQDGRKKSGLRKSRCKFGKRQQEYLSYQKARKKTKRKEKKMIKKLLKFLLRLLVLLEKTHALLSVRKIARLQTIIKIYQQQHQKAYGTNSEPIKDRIVSLSKPYVRPIVRGKEAKPVEFGAKVNKVQIDGISFIEQISFDAFNECTRYKEGIYLQRKLFGKCTHQSADTIYATNENRRYSKEQNIHTNFIPKGKQKAQYLDQAALLRKELNKERATVLEGSFGNEKNHYLLQKINARNQTTETCWIFFGMITANASIIARRMKKTTQQKARAA
jgi:transposase, IS5 family